MALSTMINDKVQTPAAHWKFQFSDDSFRRSPNINYICVPTSVEVKKRIISVIEAILFLPSHLTVLAQYWAAREIGNTIVLTTTCQPFGFWGNNKELVSYHKGCSDHKLYVHPKEGVAFGLSGRVFLNRTHEETQNLHRYNKDQRPPCENVAIFTRIWRSFAVPIIEAGVCVGVLEFVMDTPKDSNYHIDIGVVYCALEHAGFQSPPIEPNCTRNTYIHDRKRLRRTKSFEITRYCCLVPYFGLSSALAADKLGVKTSTFRNACRNVGIPEWPWIPNGTTTRSSSTTSISTESTSCVWNMGISEWSHVQTMTTQAPFSKDLFNQTTFDLGSPIAIDHMPDLSSLIPGWNVGICESESPNTQVTTTTEESISENISYEATSIVTPHATQYIASDPEPAAYWNTDSEKERANFMLHFEEMKELYIYESGDFARF